jgi:hypothetical protein
MAATITKSTPEKRRVNEIFFFKLMFTAQRSWSKMTLATLGAEM